jgi:hypothetical protein
MAQEKGIEAQTPQKVEKDTLAAQKINKTPSNQNSVTWWMMDARRLTMGRLASFASLF